MSDKNHDSSDDKKERKISEALKKVISVGIGAAFLTEDVIKNTLADLPLPKDLLTGIVQNAKSAKTDFLELVREEIHGVLSKVDPKSLLSEVLQDYDVEVTAKFSFKKKRPSQNQES